MVKSTGGLRTWRDELADNVSRAESKGGSLFWWYSEAMGGAGVYLRRGSLLPMYENIEVALAYWMSENCR